ncbi:MAG: hypothetical protein ACRETB_02500, partial [Steroidobacteraceae bacterium]
MSERAAAHADAILAIVPQEASEATLASLPQSERWRRLRARAHFDGRGGAAVSASLANARETRAVLGVLPPRATAFDTLTLAGRMLREAASREPETLVVAAPTQSGARNGLFGDARAARDGGAQADALGALVTAALAHAFEMPAFRKLRTRHPRLRRIEVIGAAGLDLGYVRTAADANNLARYLTALPPNVLDARAYRRFITTL